MSVQQGGRGATPRRSPPDASSWTHDVGGCGWGNAQLEFDTALTSNAALDGLGHLALTARQESHGGRSYTSARLKTQGLREWTHARVEARIRLPAGQGLWPAFWMLGSDVGTASWPQCGEITVYQTVARSRLPAGAPWVFDHPFFLILNLAAGGKLPGNPDASTTFPQTMLVDWVRVHQRVP